MIREKLYELKEWNSVVHTTWNPNGPGVVRIHMIPPKFTPFKYVPAVVILNGQDVLPINEAWAILLTEFVRGVNEFGDGSMNQDTLDDILIDAFHRVRMVYPNVSDATLREDLNTIVSTFEDIARNNVPAMDIGTMSLAEYAPYMTAPHRMDLMISAMAKDGHWACNQHCIHCYAAGQKYAEVQELDTEGWKRIIDRCKAARISQLTFTGGEPTLRKDLPELIHHARWFVTRLNTNGILLTKELVQKLVEAELDSVQVTLYSHIEEIHNQLVGSTHFKDTIQGIKTALEAGLNLSVNTPLCSLNRDYVGMLEFLHNLGVQYVTCSGLIVTGNATSENSKQSQLTKDEIYEIIKKAKEYTDSHDMEIDFTSPGWIDADKLVALKMVVPSCGACLSNMAITPDGNVIPCQSWLSSDTLGDMQTDSWKKIWNGKRCKSIRDNSAKAEGICPLRVMNEGEVSHE
ncbi:radical SAM/SPASM domain-containing protein [Pseudobutyrivibrio sp. MD2005]|uniref:radical SAM/SPASM domain-containing protein n=1 Tax=Pseudobutyrivibrio sp. MD2005 TaxID=1410616 RepID=UPI00055DFEB9|nr:radical SAM protein [Pseudobutyrivibrio sp. MD2005]